MEFQTAKNVFAVGLILSLGLLDVVIPGVIIVGMILVLIGIYALSQHYGRPDLFRNMLYAVIVGIVGVVILLGVVGVTAFFTILSTGHMPPAAFLPILLAIWVGVWIIIIIAASFVRKVYTGLHQVSGVDSFKTAAKLVWIGALTAIVLVGAIIYLIGEIFAIIGAFELKPPSTQQTQGTTTTI